MTPNIGMIDRYARFFLGIILIALPFLNGITWFRSASGTVFIVAVGLILIMTAVVRLCPIYRILGIETDKY